jgi:hypothetical protein
MMVRAIICCAALILGLLATIGATAQSAAVCNGPGCRAVEMSRPLDLMAFMRGGGQTSAKYEPSGTAPCPRKSARRSTRHDTGLGTRPGNRSGNLIAAGRSADSGGGSLCRACGE